MPLPQFLIIGAMKSGTTTLFRDLILNPRVFQPEDKEIGGFRDDKILSKEGLDAYTARFSRATADQICFEASVRHAFLPLHPGVPERVMSILGPKTKILYLVREPLTRSISHQIHAHRLNWCGPDINHEIRVYPILIDVSRYAMQIKPWFNRFGPANVKVIKFEDYVGDRKRYVSEISRFLDLEPCVDGIQEDVAHNKSESKPVIGPIPKAFSESSFYRYLVRPLLSLDTRERLRRLFLPKARNKFPPPSSETLDYMIEQLRGDQAELKSLPGCDHLVWDLAAAKTKILQRAATGGRLDGEDANG